MALIFYQISQQRRVDCTFSASHYFNQMIVFINSDG